MLEILEGLTLVGRDSSCDVQIAEGFVSKMHCVLACIDGRLLVLTELDYQWRDRVADLGCEHLAISVNAHRMWHTCDRCRDDALKICADQMRHLSEAFEDA